MNTSENDRIDELLNAFLDGELNQRQMTEVHRLVANDANAARRLAELEKVKALLGSLPREQAPEHMFEDIKNVLEKRSLLAVRHEAVGRRAGAAGLWGRKLLSAAAMLALVAGFSIVIYSILAPENAMRGLFSRGPTQAPAEKDVSPAAVSLAAAFSGTVELKTADALALKEAVESAAARYGLAAKDVIPTTSPEQSVYSFSGSRGEISLLLADMAGIWAGVDSAVLYVDTDERDKAIIVQNVTNEQIAQIISQGDLETQIKAARYFAVVNSIAAPGTERAAAADNEKNGFAAIPKPVLTSPEKPAKESPSGEIVTVHIVIVPAD